MHSIIPLALSLFTLTSSAGAAVLHFIEAVNRPWIRLSRDFSVDTTPPYRYTSGGITGPYDLVLNTTGCNNIPEDWPKICVQFTMSGAGVQCYSKPNCTGQVLLTFYQDFDINNTTGHVECGWNTYLMESCLISG